MAHSQRPATALAGEIYRSWATQRPVRSHSVTVDEHGSVTDDDDLEGEEAGLVYGATIAMLDRVNEQGDVSALEPTLVPSLTGYCSRKASLPSLLKAAGFCCRLSGGPSGRDGRSTPRGERVSPNSQTRQAADSAKAAAKVSLKGLLESWWAESKATGLRERTYPGYRTTILRLAKFLRRDDAARVTPSDIVAFKDHRLASTDPRTGKAVSARTVKDSDLAALKSVFGWAVRAQHSIKLEDFDWVAI